MITVFEVIGFVWIIGCAIILIWVGRHRWWEDNDEGS